MRFSPEDELIFLCSRSDLPAGSTEKIARLIQEPLNWEYILEASIIHGIAPLIKNSLDQLNSSEGPKLYPPNELQKMLNWLYDNNLARNQRLHRVLDELGVAFNQAGIPVVALKDLVLSRTVYPDLALRPIGDLDLLIHKEDFERVKETMERLGFRPVPSPDFPYTLKHAWAIHFRRPVDNVWVDVQWGVLQLEWDNQGEGNFDFEIDRVWKRAQPFTLENSQILAPNLEDMLFHLVMHLEGHQYSEFILFCDIAEFVHHNRLRIDWKSLASLAEKYKVQSSFYAIFFLLAKLLDCEVPAAFEEFASHSFKANLFLPIYGNLTDLHVALDEIYRAASPPTRIMDSFETIARSQVAIAIKAFSELNRIATELENNGVEVFIWDGVPPERIFPSEALQPFMPIRLYIPLEDEGRLIKALEKAGYQIAVSNEEKLYFREVVIQSRDPAIQGKELSERVIFRIDPHTDTCQEANPSKKEVALKALRGAGRNQPFRPQAPITVEVILISPADWFSYLARKLETSPTGKLIHLRNLLEITHRNSALANQEDEIPAVQLLKWARYGPETLNLFTSYKNLYYMAFTLKTIPTTGERLKYGMHLKILWGMARELLKLSWHTVSAPWHKKVHRTSRSLAYWAEPEGILQNSPETSRNELIA